MSFREEIIKATREIPDAVKRGSVQTTIRWKETAVNALRVANDPKSSEYELRSALNQLQKYN